MAATRLYGATDEVSDEIPAGCERISLVQVDSTGYCYYQVERPDGYFYLCDADGDKVQLPTSNWTCLRTLADVPADDPDAFFAAIEQTAKGNA